jgi:hypothetical protein
MRFRAQRGAAARARTHALVARTLSVRAATHAQNGKRAARPLANMRAAQARRKNS